MNKIILINNVEWDTLMNEEESFKEKLPSNLGVVYFIDYGDFVKIGQTLEINSRKKQLYSMSTNYMGRTIKRIFVSPYHIKFKENEKLLHEYFKEYRIESGELFNLSILEIINRLNNLSLDFSCIKENEEEFIEEHFWKIMHNNFYIKHNGELILAPIHISLDDIFFNILKININDEQFYDDSLEFGIIDEYDDIVPEWREKDMV